MNPYQSPDSDSDSSSQGIGVQITQGMVDQLLRTRGWVRFMSVLAFIFAGLMVLGGLGMVAIGGLAALGEGDFEAVGVSVGMGMVYVVLAVFYCLPGWWLHRYASAITQVQSYQDAESFEIALDRQRGFWKGIGVMVIVGVVLYLTMIVVVMAVAIFAAAAGT